MAELQPPDDGGDTLDRRLPTAEAGDAISLAPGVYAELARIVVGTQPLGVVLHQVAELARGVIEGADDVSVTLIERGRPRSVAFAGDGQLAALLDERQYEKGFGPCLDASASASVIVLQDMAEENVYPDFARLASRRGVRRSMSVGLPTVQLTTGALNIYSSRPGRFGPGEVDAATLFAGCAAVAMANAALYAGAVEEVAQMKEALASRAGIEQAKGMIMQERRCTAEEAFTVLRDLSSHQNRKLRDVAQDIIEAAIEP